MSFDGPCVTCHVSPGRRRLTRLFTVVCGPCWAAHGGKPDAGEIAAAPKTTAPLRYPKGQRGYLAALARADWVQDVRIDGRDNLLAIARVLALTANWETLETWPGWETLCARTGLSETTIQRWLQELKLRGWLVVVETGSTPLTRPMALRSMTLLDGTEVFLEGNRRAVYALRIPLSPDEAIAWAAQTIAAEAAAEAARAAEADAARRRARAGARARGLLLKALSTAYDPERVALEAKARELIAEHSLTDDELVDPEIDAARRRRDEARAAAEQLRLLALQDDPEIRAMLATYLDRLRDPETATDQAEPFSGGDKKGWPTFDFPEGEVAEEGGFAREATAVDDCGAPISDRWGGNDQKSALRARSDREEPVNWASRVPTSDFQMLCAAAWLRHRLPIFAQLSRFAVRTACKSLYEAGWSNLDIVHAMDHAPSPFGATTLAPHRRGPDAILRNVSAGQPRTWRYYAAVSNWITGRLDAWRDADGHVLPGYYQNRGRRVAIRRAVADRHGRAGVRLLQHTGPDVVTGTGLTADVVAEFGRRVAAELRQHQAVDERASNRPAPSAAASEQTRDQAREKFDATTAEKRARAAADRHATIVDSHREQLEQARAQLATATGAVNTPAADPQVLAEQDALTPQQRHEKARAAVAGFRRGQTGSARNSWSRRRWSR
ncbi:helix-turn-helix domain-containing protein [Amycolatopsis sp. lyj-23]|uniref:helix-turn-helix domain-containing protein n=1 Tax=Amycolatopsis sp. lyj-23 TaxID=2789283 RepID=UPI003979D7A2